MRKGEGRDEERRGERGECVVRLRGIVLVICSSSGGTREERGDSGREEKTEEREEEGEAGKGGERTERDKQEGLCCRLCYGVTTIGTLPKLSGHFRKEPYKNWALSQKRPDNVKSLLTQLTPFYQTVTVCFKVSESKLKTKASRCRRRTPTPVTLDAGETANICSKDLLSRE